MRVIPEDNLKYPVLVDLGGGRSASGFYYFEKQDIYFVTAKHVLFDTEKGGAELKLKADFVTLLSYPKEVGLTAPIEYRLDLARFHSTGALRVHADKDVAVVKWGEAAVGKEVKLAEGVQLLPRAAGKAAGTIVAVTAQSTKRYADLLLGNEVYIFGYPASLGIRGRPQINYRQPLLRKGVIAGKNDEKSTIILDCPVYPGNSGGPVMEVEQVKVAEWRYSMIGVVSEFVPYVDIWQSLSHGNLNTFVNNSGYSVVAPIDSIHDLLTKGT